MAADGYSRTNDRKKFGVFVMQDAAGAENSMGALSQAYADNIPVLVMPAGYPIVVFKQNQISGLVKCTSLCQNMLNLY